MQIDITKANKKKTPGNIQLLPLHTLSFPGEIQRKSPYNIKQKGRKKYINWDIFLIQEQILSKKINKMWNVWKTVQRNDILILEVKGWQVQKEISIRKTEKTSLS